MPSNRPQVKYRVSPDVKDAFENYVDRMDETGQGRYGRHLEKAMRQYVHGGDFEGLRQTVDNIADSLGVEKVKGKGTVAMADGRYHVPEGKNPGDVSARQRAVITHLADLADDDRLPSDEYGHWVTQKVLMEEIERVADVHSQKTVKRYLKGITKRGPFKSHPDRPGVWVVKT